MVILPRISVVIFLRISEALYTRERGDPRA
jgi:hypothetical protein